MILCVKLCIIFYFFSITFRLSHFQWEKFFLSPWYVLCLFIHSFTHLLTHYTHIFWDSSAVRCKRQRCVSVKWMRLFHCFREKWVVFRIDMWSLWLSSFESLEFSSVTSFNRRFLVYQPRSLIVMRMKIKMKY